jgi:hypothetical protein
VHRQPLALAKAVAVADQLLRRRHRVAAAEQPGQLGDRGAQRGVVLGREQPGVAGVTAAVATGVGHAGLIE